MVYSDVAVGTVLTVTDYTTQEYLERVRCVGAPFLSPADLAISCLKYLSVAVSTDMAMKYLVTSCSLSRLFNVSNDDPPLLNYAVKGWGMHSRNLENHKVTEYAVRLLYDDSMIALFGNILLGKWRRWCGSGLHLCSFFGLRHIAGTLLKHGCRPDPWDGRRRLPSTRMRG